MSKVDTTQVLTKLTEILSNRKNASAEDSYVASLHAKGLNKILEKVGEEATEVIIAAKDANTNGDLKELVSETADLWFHTLVMLSNLGSNADAVLEELARRFDISGLEEKSNRSK